MFVAVEELARSTTLPGATPTVPELVSVEATAFPMTTEPSASRAPVFVIGPSRVRLAAPVPEGSAVRDPSFSAPAATARRAPVGPAAAVPAVPIVRALPLETVSSPTEKEPRETTTVAPAEMQTSTPVPSGTPVLQLAAVSQSLVPPPPVHRSVQLSVESAAGATPMSVRP